ncbi:(2Fe-2S)-binding protein [Anaeromusa acidaminophila]|uniref:(2Fe-2S)-binding protein n=1 Tax=Anaeromusa acidaminophila TaxID=81464 RepID=UPI0003700269|nr:(2Fe-2S)-binding protein [Anaeromusa acidaminophila]
MNVSFVLNGKQVSIDTPPDRRVVDLLREDFGLIGTKECCGEGECGACTILVNRSSRLSCLMAAAQLEGADIVTIEGVATEENLSVVQQAFIDCGAVQCGFCTPGMVLAVLDLLYRNPLPSEAEVREGISGNLCRCTGYQKIVEAALMAAAKLQGRTS